MPAPDSVRASLDWRENMGYLHNGKNEREKENVRFKTIQRTRTVLSAAGAGRPRLSPQTEVHFEMVGFRGAGRVGNLGRGALFHEQALNPVATLDPSATAASMRASLMKFFRLILFFAVTFPLASSRAEMADGVKAIVNDTVITYAQVKDFIAPAADSLQQQYSAQPDVYSQKLGDLISDGLEQLEERVLILHDFDMAGYKLPDSILDDWVQDNIRKRFGDRVALMKMLQAQGMTLEQYRGQVRDQNIESYMRSKNIAADKIIISPYKIENYYLAHQDDFKVGDQIKLRMIILNKTGPDDTNTLAMGGEIVSKIKAGATFQEMASSYSQGKESGDWYERPALRKELADAAFALKPGQVSDAVETPDSVYILFVEQARAAHVRPLGEIRDGIEKNLRTQEQMNIEKQWIEKLKRKTYIRIIP